MLLPAIPFGQDKDMERFDVRKSGDDLNVDGDTAVLPRTRSIVRARSQCESRTGVSECRLDGRTQCPESYGAVGAGGLFISRGLTYPPGKARSGSGRMLRYVTWSVILLQA